MYIYTLCIFVHTSSGDGCPETTSFSHLPGGVSHGCQLHVEHTHSLLHCFLFRRRTPHSKCQLHQSLRSLGVQLEPPKRCSLEARCRCQAGHESYSGQYVNTHRFPSSSLNHVTTPGFPYEPPTALRTLSHLVVPSLLINRCPLVSIPQIPGVCGKRWLPAINIARSLADKFSQQPQQLSPTFCPSQGIADQSTP